MKELLKFYMTILGFILLIITIGWIIKESQFNDHICNGYTVTEKQTKKMGETDKYLIFTEKNGIVKVFENTDVLIRCKFNSSDLYGKIKVGETYNFKTIGFRNGFMSWYENILEIEEVKKISE